MADEIAVGIDLGTTNSCVGVVRNGRVEIIANELGFRTTPSVVAFTDKEVLVGVAAKELRKSSGENVIYDCKRVMGRKFDDKELQANLQNWPFEVIEDSNDNPVFQVEYKDEEKTYTPEEISAMILTKMKSIASEFTGVDVKNAVITVPAYFNDSQRQATIDAGKIAGLNVLEIINEPTAAALSYQVDRNNEKKQNVLVYDLGGGTFDVAVLSIDKGEIDVKAVSGDMNLGGSDFDNFILDYCKKKISNERNDSSSNVDVARDQCESAKLTLSTKLQTEMTFDSPQCGPPHKITLKRSKFEDLCYDLFDKTIDLVKEALDDAEMDKSDIDEVILVGGSTRIPRIQELLQEFFEGKKLNKTINPDEAVAYGATVRAATLCGDKTLEEIELLDVVPMALGVTVRRTETSVIIPKNTKIPVTKTVPFTTGSDYQRMVKIKVQEIHPTTEENHQLGCFELNHIESGKKGSPRIFVTFKVDRNGIFQVSAKDSSTSMEKQIEISSYKGRLQDVDIEHLRKESKKFQKHSQNEKKRLAAQYKLDSFCTQMKNGITKKMKEGCVSNEKYTKITEMCTEILEWLEDNPEATKLQFNQKKKECGAYCNRVLSGSD